jgi:hypothetical protein
MLLEEHRATREESRLIFDRFAGSGGALIDITDGYQKGQSEDFSGSSSPLIGTTSSWPRSTPRAQTAPKPATAARTWFAR